MLAIALALCLLATAGYLHRSALATLRGHVWTPLDRPVQLHAGQVLAAAFATDLDADYEIALQVGRGLPQQETDCLLGIEVSAQARCAGIVPVGTLRWAVRSGERTVASGSSQERRHGGYWNAQHVGRLIGQFRGAPGGSYELVVEGTTDEPRLNGAAPAVRVSVGVQRFKDAAITAQLRELAAITAGAAGLLLLVGAALAAVYRRIRAERISA